MCVLSTTQKTAAVSQIMSLKLITWNLAGNAIHKNGSNENHTARFSQILSTVQMVTPDVVLVQESTLPLEMWQERGYERAGFSAKSHGEGVTEIYYQPTSCKVLNAWNMTCHWPLPFPGPKDIYNFPAATFELMTGHTVTVMSVHLIAGAQAVQPRAVQMRLIEHALRSSGKPVIVAGDFNMRDHETWSACDILGIQDAYIHAGSPKPHRFTWNSCVNEYHKHGMQFTARFDRVLGNLQNADILDFQIIGNTPQPGNVYLSDHFGIYVNLQWKH